MRLLGDPIGGFLLVAVGIKSLICADAVSYLASALAVLMTSRRTSRSARRDAIVGSLAATLTATAAGYLLLHSASLRTALPTAAVTGMSGSMSLVIAQTTMHRVTPNAVLGRVSAVFLTVEAAATLAGAVVGPLVAQAAGLTTLAAAASFAAVAAAAAAFAGIP